VPQFLLGEGDRIGFHAAGLGGFGNEFAKVCRLHSVRGQAWNAQIGDQPRHPLHGVRSPGFYVACQNLSDFVLSTQRRAGRLALAQGREICSHDVRQEHGADRPVRRGEHAANGTGEAVHSPESRIG
jgi:hypothetical protein